MSRTYLIDGQQVTASWISRQFPPVYTITVAGTPTAGSIEKTVGGKFHAIDDRDRSLGYFLGLRAAVEQLVREEQRSSRPRLLRCGPDSAMGETEGICDGVS